MRRYFLIGAVVFWPVVNSVAHATLQDDLESYFVSANSFSVAGRPINVPELVRRFYQLRGYRPAWQDEANSLLQQLIDTVKDSATHGLSPEDYHASALLSAVERDLSFESELLATDAYLSLGAHLRHGKLNPVTIEPDWTIARRAFDGVAHLSEAISRRRIAEYLQDLAPPMPVYHALRGELKSLEKTMVSDASVIVPTGPPLKPGDRGSRVELLNRRLRVSAGPMPFTRIVPAEVYGEATVNAVKKFQQNFGLEADGVVGAATLKELNRSPGDRAAQVRANLERWRWLPDELGSRHIRVNIAAYRLQAWSQGKVAKTFDVIVGRTYRQTPVFSGNMSYLVLNPWWEVPRNIARLDKRADFQRDPGLPMRTGIDVYDSAGKQLDPSGIRWSAYSRDNFPFRLRQRPGPHNALGEVKLMFPNHHNVYLHGTPLPELFGKGKRDFSSGCIRVNRVRDLVSWVMAGMADWSRDRIEQQIGTGQVLRVDLLEKIPVHIFYMTVVRDPKGRVQFLPDVYNRDGRLIAALNRPLSLK